MSSPDLDQTVRLLIIDDDAVDRASVRRHLRSNSLQATLFEADGYPAALPILQQEVLDCILLDYYLPGSDGSVVLQALRAAGSTVPVIILTGHGDEQTAVALLKAGAADYLVKDQLTAETLVGSIRHVLRLAHAEREAQAAQTRLQLLAASNDILVSSLDYRVTLPQVATLLVEEVADCCTIDLRQEGDRIERVAMAFNPTLDIKPPAAAARPVALDDPYGPGMVFRTEQATHYTNVWQELSTQLRPDHAAFVAATGLTSWVSVPVQVRNTPLGVLALGRHQTHPPLAAADIALAADVARRVALAIENALLYQQAQEAIQTRDAFLSIAAHELKNPLAALLGYAQLLERRMQRQQQLTLRDQPMLEKMTNQVRRLHGMIQALFDVSRFQLGQLALELAPVDLSLLTSEILQPLEPTLEQHTVQVVIPSEPLLVLGDAMRLEQVVSNLLQNAIKYSPMGGMIRVQVMAAEGGVVLEVADEGIGIPQAAQEAIFQRFYRAPNTATHGLSGMGVGLYVVQQIVELHQGRITVTSQEGQGSTFRLWLPAVKPGTT